VAAAAPVQAAVQKAPPPARKPARHSAPLPVTNQQNAGPAPTKAPAKSKAKTRKSNGAKRLFVLDTNVLMHDPMSLFRFEEHDIYLPMIVLEELDSNKKGMTEVARQGVE
jgi:PhoH-like ATPase